VSKMGWFVARCSGCVMQYSAISAIRKPVIHAVDFLADLEADSLLAYCRNDAGEFGVPGTARLRFSPSLL